MAETLRNALYNQAPYVELAKLAGVDPDMQVTVYTEASVAGAEGVAADTLPSHGLVLWCWETRDELHLDGKVLWRSDAQRFTTLTDVATPGGYYAVYEHNNDLGSMPKLVEERYTSLVSEVHNKQWRWVAD